MRSKNPDLFKRIEDYIDSYIQENNRSPSTREIASHLGVALSSASRYLKYMRENNVLDYSGHRNIRTTKQRLTSLDAVTVPVLGHVSCGVPKLAEENIEEYVSLPASIFGHGDFFLLRANGNSMIEAGIDDCDLILVRKQNYASPGDIVVALIENEDATLKRYFPDPENHQIILHPENRELRDIIVPSCLIQGVAVKVLKDLSC